MTSSAPRTPHDYSQDTLVFLPLGGSGEIGMNLNLYGYRGQWLMVDCGITFADEGTPWLDILMPDPSFISEQSDKLLGLVVTHAHEDHIGAIPHLWPELRCPIYASPFTLSVLKRKLAEKSFAKKVPLHSLPLPGQAQIGPFSIESLCLTHSIPEPAALVLRTDQHTVLHTGDWKLDPDPVEGDPFDQEALKALAKEDNVVVVCDSTNVFVEGTSGSEADVGANLAQVIKGCKRRVAVACFASNIARLRSIAEAAEAADRSVVLLGRSLDRMVSAALENGYLEGLRPFIAPEDAAVLPPENTLYICTGSQGEPRSALSMIASGRHNALRLDEGDTVIFSSRVIPGNEKSISRLHNRLSEAGIAVITDKSGDIHVSGHPGQAELKQLYHWVQPQTVIPVHGEQRHMQAQAQLAQSCQVAHTLVPQNGSVVTLSPQGKPEEVTVIETGRLALHGSQLRSQHAPLFRTLHKALEQGHATATVCLEEDDTTCFAHPLVLSTLGVLSDEEVRTLTPEIQEYLEEELEALPTKTQRNLDVIRDLTRKCVREVIREETGLRPRVDVHLLLV